MTTDIPPGYIRGPLTPAHRAKLQAAHLRRLGIPMGMCRIYGMLFKVEHREELANLGHQIKRKYGIATARAVLAIVYGRILSQEIRKQR